MTTADNRGQGPQEQVTVHRIQTVVEPTQYASVQPMPNYNVTRSGTDWGTIALVGIVGAVLFALIGVGFYNLGCHDKACYDAVAAVGVARANASAGVPTDVGENGTISACTGACWEAQKVKAGANANARAGFGSNTGTDTVTAVPRPNNVAAPAPEIKVIYPPAPLASVNGCGRNCPGNAKPTHLGEAACQRVGGVRYELDSASGYHRCYNAQGQRISPSGSVIASR